MRKSKSEKRCDDYDQFSEEYDAWDAEHRSVERQRRSLVRSLKGKILEVGVGTGANLEYYPEGADVTGIDVSTGMLEKAVMRARARDCCNIKLLNADAENIPFLDDTFDAVVGTFVFCSFEDPLRAAREVKRVVKSGGVFVTLGYHTKMVAKILQESGWIIRSQLEWDSVDRPIGKIVARKTVDSIWGVGSIGDHSK
ncbi:MAG: class I SAM-dependent methyltransferase [Opitutaceae bacterium]